MSNPFITAICVSHSSRFGLLQRAILNFASQSYEDRELIIMVNQDGYQDMIHSFLTDPRLDLGKAHDKIQVLFASFRSTTDGARLAATRAKGDYFVCWDDDNLSAPVRLAMQLERTIKNDAPTVYSESLYYFYDSDELFVANYAQPSGAPVERCAASSLMLARKDWPLDIPDGERRTWAVAVLSVLAQQRHYQFISGHPGYFLAGSNGDNWRPAEMHRRLASGLPLSWSREQLLSRQDEVAGWLSGYAFPNSEVDVCGKDARAFSADSLQTYPTWFASPLPAEDWQLNLPNPEYQQRKADLRRDERQDEAADPEVIAKQQERRARAAAQAAAHAARQSEQGR